jgi:hypothetical protein
VAGAEPLSELETLRFENEKLRRRIEELLSPREQDRQTRLTLEFQILKLTADLKSLAAGVAADQSEPAPAVHPPLPEPPAPLQRPDCEVGHTAVSDPDHAA